MLSALPNTSVYIDAGAADWNRDDPQKAVRMLFPMGIRWARGFALNSTHYDSTERQVRYAAEVSQALAKRGIPGKYGVINTASNGKPFKGYKYNGPNFDNARACTSASDKHCVTLGIPPTVDVADPKWGLNPHDRRLAARYVDAYMWFGRPWLYNQASPFDMNRALTLARTTPYLSTPHTAGLPRGPQRRRADVHPGHVRAAPWDTAVHAGRAVTRAAVAVPAQEAAGGRG
jgi:hypothetical protein